MVKRVQGGKLIVLPRTRDHSKRRTDDDVRKTAERIAKILKSARIELLAPASLIPNPDNPRTHSQDQVAKLVGSIDRFGFLLPILTDESNRVLAGHARLMAALALALEEVP